MSSIPVWASSTDRVSFCVLFYFLDTFALSFGSITKFIVGGSSPFLGFFFFDFFLSPLEESSESEELEKEEESG